MFKLPKRHKTDCKYNWKKSNIIFNDNFDEWYARYINSNECEKCNEPYKNKTNRCMDHDHNTGEPRNILCLKCNTKTDKKLNINNTTGHQYIHKSKDKKYKLGFAYKFKIRREDTILIDTQSSDLEKIIKIRDEWIKDNPQYF